MTRHTTTSTTRRAAVGLMALSLLLSGCSAGPRTESSASTPAATATRPADPKEIAADIAATFPTEAEWLETYTDATVCVSAVPASCGGTQIPRPRAYSNGVNLRDGASTVTAQAVILAVEEWGSDEAAQAEVDRAEADDTLIVAGSDVRTGTITDYERAGWGGYRLTQVPVETVDSSATSVIHLDSSIRMRNGPLVFTFRLYEASAEPGVAEAEAKGWLDRVFGPE
jgi:hypothetical protein